MNLIRAEQIPAIGSSNASNADVPCGGCNACCRSGYFIHVEPDEQEALASIPTDLLFPAPGLPSGHRVMGYAADGACPMLVDDACSIYSARPRACRRYDCRVFALTDVDPGADKPLVRERVREWRMDDDPVLQDQLRARRTAAQYLHKHSEALPALGNPGQVALMAIEIAPLFVEQGFIEQEPSLETVQARLGQERS